MVIVHIAHIKLNHTSGMGRIACHWRDAFTQEGHQFYHIGSDEIDKEIHFKLWGIYARNFLKKMKIKPDIVLVHEPHGLFFLNRKFKTIVFSHGLEERGWQVQQKFNFVQLTFRNKIFLPFFRFFSNNIGLRYADKIFLSNREDLKYLTNEKKIKANKIWIFNNGYYPFANNKGISKEVVFLFNASWIQRKGIKLMYYAFNLILEEFPNSRLLISGTGASADAVLVGFNQNVHSQIQVIPIYPMDEEINLYAKTSIFLMPSFFEGQSVALTQAMAMGLFPIAADNCGQNDFIKHNENGLLFKTGDEEDFYQKIKWALHNPEEINEMAMKAKESVNSLLWGNVTKQIVYESLEICK